MRSLKQLFLPEASLSQSTIECKIVVVDMSSLAESYACCEESVTVEDVVLFVRNAT